MIHVRSASLSSKHVLGSLWEFPLDLSLGCGTETAPAGRSLLPEVTPILPPSELVHLELPESLQCVLPPHPLWLLAKRSLGILAGYWVLGGVEQGASTSRILTRTPATGQHCLSPAYGLSPPTVTIERPGLG